MALPRYSLHQAGKQKKAFWRDEVKETYETGVEHGRADAKIVMSMAYERHAEDIDRRFEPYFIHGVRALLEAAPLMRHRSEAKRTGAEPSIP